MRETSNLIKAYVPPTYFRVLTVYKTALLVILDLLFCVHGFHTVGYKDANMLSMSIQSIFQEK